MYGAYLRVWQCATKRTALAWMASHAARHPELASAPERSAVDPLWRTAAVAQTTKEAYGGAAHRGVSCATLLIDIKQLFDRLPPPRAFHFAVEAGLPFWQVRFAFAG